MSITEKDANEYIEVSEKLIQAISELSNVGSGMVDNIDYLDSKDIKEITSGLKKLLTCIKTTQRNIDHVIFRAKYFNDGSAHIEDKHLI